MMKRGLFCLLLLALVGCTSTPPHVPLHAEAEAFASKIQQSSVDAVIEALQQAVAGDTQAVEAMQAKRRTYDTPPPEGVSLAEGTLANCPTRFYSPAQVRKADAIVLYIHGGGWVLGVVEEYARFCGELAKASGLPVAAISYRLAPQHPFPAGLNDVLQAIEELRSKGYREIFLMGDSAGGNLAAVAGLHFRERLAGVILLYPAVRLDYDGSESWARYGQGCGLPDDLMLAFCEAYLHNAGTDVHDPRLSPLFAKDFRRFPRTLLLAASNDILRDQGLAFAEKLRKADVEVTYQNFPGAIHSFLTYPNQERDFQGCLEATVRFLAVERPPVGEVEPEVKTYLQP